MSGRADRLVELLPELGVDAMLVTGLCWARGADRGAEGAEVTG
jgi:hypothetical protein